MKAAPGRVKPERAKRLGPTHVSDDDAYDALLRAVRRLPAQPDLTAGHTGLFDAAVHAIQLVSMQRDGERLPATHHRYDLLLALRGEGCLFMERGVWAIAPGDCYLFAPYTLHLFTRFVARVDWLLIRFACDRPDLLTGLLGGCLKLTRPALAHARTLTEVQVSAARKCPQAALDMSSWASLLLTELLRANPDGGNIPRLMETTQQQHQVQRIVAYIHRNLQAPFRLRTMARELELSEGHVRRIFHLAFPMGLMHFVRRARVDRAAGLLQHSSLNITEVGQACGFNSVYAFSRAFHVLMGESPREYRKRFET